MEIKVLGKENWYNKSKEYWSNTENTLKGMLGGNDKVNDSDVKTSCELLEGLIISKRLNPNKIIDCGAGIGRVTLNVLLNYFNEIDLLEQDKKFIETAKEIFKGNNKVCDYYNSSLQEFEFTKSYDVIWIQWCLENLEDEDLIAFLKKCKKALEVGGLIIIKENIVSFGSKYYDGDYTKLRSDTVFKQLFNKCGLKIYKHFHHPNWPEDLLKVSVYILE